MKKWFTIIFCLAMGLFLWGCTGVEPEKRAYPLVLGVDVKDGQYRFSYGMPNMPASTGQEKEDSSQKGTPALAISGSTFEDIYRDYNRTQEKYLDFGHLEVLLLGRGMEDKNRWEPLLNYLKDHKEMGEDIYVFSIEDMDAVMSLNGGAIDSLGDYLKGIYENRPAGQTKKGVTLRDVYYSWYEKDELPSLPKVVSAGQDQVGIEDSGFE